MDNDIKTWLYDILNAIDEIKDFIFVTLGTGLGSGIVVDGRLVYGHDGFAGELGHTIVIQNGRMCGCGRRGCLEQYCSATGLVKTYFEILSSNNPESKLFLNKERPFSKIKRVVYFLNSSYPFSCL